MRNLKPFQLSYLMALTYVVLALLMTLFVPQLQPLVLALILPCVLVCLAGGFLGQLAHCQSQPRR